MAKIKFDVFNRARPSDTRTNRPASRLADAAASTHTLQLHDGSLMTTPHHPAGEGAMDELIERLRKAKGPDSKLNGEIRLRIPNRPHCLDENHTGSLSDAVTLIRPGWAWHVMRDGITPTPRAELAEPIHTQFGAWRRHPGTS